MRTGTKIVWYAAGLLAVLIVFAVFIMPVISIYWVAVKEFKNQIFELIQSLIPWVGSGFLGNEGRKALENKNGRPDPSNQPIST